RTCPPSSYPEPAPRIFSRCPEPRARHGGSSFLFWTRRRGSSLSLRSIPADGPCPGQDCRHRRWECAGTAQPWHYRDAAGARRKGFSSSPQRDTSADITRDHPMFGKSVRVFLAFLILALAPFPAFAADVTMFAAASLSGALKEIASDYQAQSGKTVAVSFAASSALARQIEASGGADIFMSADLDWMDYLDKKGLIA